MLTFCMRLQLSLLLLLSCPWASSLLMGWVESPRYPHGYLPHTTLNWSRCARKGHIISIQLIHLDLEDSQNCENDAVKVGLQQNQEPSAAPLFQTHFSLCAGVCRRKLHLRSVWQKKLCWASVVSQSPSSLLAGWLPFAFVSLWLLQHKETQRLQRLLYRTRWDASRRSLQMAFGQIFDSMSRNLESWLCFICKICWLAQEPFSFHFCDYLLDLLVTW